MRKVKLTNASKPRRGLVFNLSGGVASEKIERRTYEMDKTGEKRLRISNATIAKSLHIPYGHTVEVPESYLKVRDIDKALRNGNLRLKVVEMESSGPKPRRRGRRK